MDAPPSFWRLCLHFHQDVDSFVSVGEPEAPEAPLIDYLVSFLLQDERAELARFLDRALVQPDAGDSLLRLWNKSQADFRFERASEIHGFLVAVRRRL